MNDPLPVPDVVDGELTLLDVTVETTRFGAIKLPLNDVHHFPEGLLGFPEEKGFVFIDPDPGTTGGFYWMQSVKTPGLAFVVWGPMTLEGDVLQSFQKAAGAYLDAHPTPEPTPSHPMGPLPPVADAEAYLICNKVGVWITVNLLGPLLVWGRQRVVQQVVMPEGTGIPTRHPFLPVERGVGGVLGLPAAASKSVPIYGDADRCLATYFGGGAQCQD